MRRLHFVLNGCFEAADRAILFRVGMSIGDAIADGTDLHGEAVNFAARLQAACPTRRICVSRAVRDHVHGRLHLEFQALGPLGLKNIARPVEAVLVQLNSMAQGSVEQALMHASSDALPFAG